MDSATNVLRRSARRAFAWAAITVALTLGALAMAAGVSGATTQTAHAKGSSARPHDASAASPGAAYLLVGVVGVGAAFTGRRVHVLRFD